MFGKTLFYPGCVARFKNPKLIDDAKRVLNLLKIDFVENKDILCCGNPFLQANKEKEFSLHGEKNKVFLKGVKKIITLCPTCAKIFSEEYKIKTEHIVLTISKNLQKIPNGDDKGPIGFHEPCDLKRLGLSESAREILIHLGYEVIEPSTHICCGGGGGLEWNHPETSKKISKLRSTQFKTKDIISCCPRCESLLKDNGKNIKDICEVIE